MLVLGWITSGGDAGQGTLEAPKTIKVIAIDADCSPELGGTTLLPKTSPCFDYRTWITKVRLSRCHTVQAAGGRKGFNSLSSCEVCELYNTNLAGQMRVLV